MSNRYTPGQNVVVQGVPVEEVDSDEHYVPGELIGLQSTAVKNGFVKKVYSILTVQLIVTTLIAAPIANYGMEMKLKSPEIVSTMMFLSLAAVIAIMCVFTCCPQTMRDFPTNYFLLGLFTVAEAVMVGFVCANYTAQSVIMCLAITAVCVGGLTLFACQTKYDFTGLLPYFLTATFVLCGFSFMLMMGAMLGGAGSGFFRAANMVYAAFGALLFCGYIVVDTQMIIGGKHSTYSFTVDDYCMAAITLYIDIIQLFLYLLQLFGDRND